jgi:deazaflavin-dependent oxidoreductase (nitroreductase family)
MPLPDTLAELGARALRTRWLVRSPIRLYRAGLGFLFGSRMIMIEHIGRRSGTRRHVVLEVVDHPAPHDYVIVSGFGDKSQWYRNIQAEPRVRVWVGTRRAAPATATPMTDQESAAALNHYIQQHPRAWKQLRATIERATDAPVDTLPMVRVHINGA